MCPGSFCFVENCGGIPRAARQTPWRCTKLRFYVLAVEVELTEIAVAFPYHVDVPSERLTADLDEYGNATAAAARRHTRTQKLDVDIPTAKVSKKRIFGEIYAFIGTNSLVYLCAMLEQSHAALPYFGQFAAKNRARFKQKRRTVRRFVRGLRARLCHNRK